MREILFRGKVVGFEKWAVGFLRPDYAVSIKKSNEYITLERKFFIDQYEKDEDGNLLKVLTSEVDEETICQYTGLTDKNGTMIFEGDIVKYTNNQKGLYDIGQKMKGFVWFDKNIGCYMSKNNFQKHIDFWFAKDIQVIGNIYENKDLL